MRNYNVSILFSNLKTEGMGAFQFGDYAAIKNGSYSKLMKAYYAPETARKPDKTTQTNQIKDVTSKDTTGLSKLRKETDGLHKAAEVLQDEKLWKETEGKLDTDKVTSAVKKFASAYNDVIDQSGKVTSSDVAQQTKYMTSLTQTMSKALSKVGVTVGADGKLAVNEDTLKNARKDDVKALFAGKYSYADQVGDKANAISSAVVRSASTYSSDGNLNHALSSIFDQML